MPARILDGKTVAGKVYAELRPRVEALRDGGVVPTLRVLLVGEDAASAAYVRNKERAGAALGIRVWVERVPASPDSVVVEHMLDVWAKSPEDHGIVLQRSAHVLGAGERWSAHIPPEKDVDGLHPENVGWLVRGTPRFLPPTPAGILRLLREYEIPLEGAHVVVIGRGPLVGKPLALMLLQKQPGGNATVTVCHRQTGRLSALTRLADILVVAAGVPRLVTAEHVRPGATVVDAGIHRTAGGWVGDVDQGAVRDVAGALTPVPGGVGPMTVALLLANVVQAAEATLLSSS